MLFLFVMIYYILYRITFDTVRRTVCSSGQEINVTLPMSVEATSFSKTPVSFQLKAEIITNLTVGQVIVIISFKISDFLFILKNQM